MNCRRCVQSLVVVLALGLAFSAEIPASAADTLLVPDDFPTIQSAVDAANPAGGDTIMVGPGEFAGALITNPVRVIGVGDDTRITSGNFAYSFIAFVLDGDSFEIDGTEISNLVIEYEGLQLGLVAYLADNVTISNITINDSVNGIVAQYADGVTVNHVEINNTPSPVFAVFSDGFTANNNTLTNSCRGIEARYSEGCTFNHNSVIGLVPYAGVGSVRHCDGIVIVETTNCVAAHNYVWHVGSAVGGFDEELYVGMAMGSLGGPHESNSFHHNQIEVSVPDADWSGSIALSDYGVIWWNLPISVKENEVMHNDLCGSGTGVFFGPIDLQDHNLLKHNQCGD